MLISDFLLARIREDEEFIHAARRFGAVHKPVVTAEALEAMADDPEIAEQLVRFTVLSAPGSAERTLAECEVKRRILRMHAAYPVPQRTIYGTITACDRCGDVDDSLVEWPCGTIRTLATVYADHPDFQEEWR